jgi:hypothetical protein
MVSPFKPLRKGEQELIEGKSLQPNTIWLQIHWPCIQTTEMRPTKHHRKACSISNKMVSPFKPLRKGDQDLIEGKRLQPNTIRLQIHWPGIQITENRYWHWTFCSLNSVVCIPGQWICSRMVFDRRLLPSVRSSWPFLGLLKPLTILLPMLHAVLWCSVTFCSLNSVVCIQSQWICSQMVFGRRLFPSMRSCWPSLSGLKGLTILLPMLQAFLWRFVMFCSLISVIRIQSQWICSRMVFGRRLFPSMRSCWPFLSGLKYLTILLPLLHTVLWCFVVSIR